MTNDKSREEVELHHINLKDLIWYGLSQKSVIISQSFSTDQIVALHQLQSERSEIIFR